MSVGEHVDLEPASSHRPGTNGRPGRATRQRPTAPAHTVGASAEAHDAYAFPPHPSSTARLRALLVSRARSLLLLRGPVGRNTAGRERVTCTVPPVGSPDGFR
jgi:hypothetical protein